MEEGSRVKTGHIFNDKILSVPEDDPLPLLGRLRSGSTGGAHFEEFFEALLKKMYGLEFKIAKWMDWITEENGKCFLTDKGTCYYHYI